jgi:hypothetical protein
MDDRLLSKLGGSRAAVLAVGMVAALLAACGGGGGSGYTSPTSGAGTGTGTGGTGTPSTPTSITLTSPGTTVNRTVTVTATPVAGTGATITSVSFLVDGASIGSATTSPYTAQWNTSTVTDGAHSLTASATDSMGATVTSAAVSVNVLNNPQINVALSPAQIYPAPTSTGSGAASITVDLATGATTGKVQVAGVTATGISINQGFAGATGASVITLMQNATITNEFDVPAGTTLTADQVTALLQGGLYVIATSAANPNGEVRAQLAPSNITVVWATLAGSQEVPPVTITAAGVAAITVDSIANTVTVNLNTTGVSDATDAEIDTGASGATGPKLVALIANTANTGAWSVTLSAIAVTDVANFTAGSWYINVITPEDTTGAIRGQITIPAAPTTPTLTELQTTIFTPICSGCHDGVGNMLPGGLNLTAGGPFNAMVNQPTIEQPTLKFVAPGDPTDSYLVQKLLGSTGITGARMPLGGPYLDAATIAEVQAWITAGALNN